MNVQEGEPSEKATDRKAFTETKNEMRFSEVTDNDLDALEGENNAQSTHWQANWAVGVMRGIFYSNIFHFHS